MLFSILIFLIVLSILVLVHEFGHFIIAKKTGVYVEEFGLGLPPRVYGKKIGETLFSLNLLPFGGFVKLHGESDESGVTQPERAFLNKNKRVRTAIIVMGVLMNLVLSVVCFGIIYTVSGIPKETENVKVVGIAPSSPAQTSGVLSGDFIRKVDGKDVKSVKGFISLVEEKKGGKVVVEIERIIEEKSNFIKLTLSPRAEPPSGEGPLGVVITTTETYYPPIYLRPLYGIYYGAKDALFWGKEVVNGFIKIFVGLRGGEVPSDLAGPVGIFAVTSQAAKFGLLSVINFMGILSINLAILNILPFPALDGGRLLFIGIEALWGKKVLPKVESFAHTVGMIILLLLILAISARDIQRIISAGGISGFLESLTPK